MFVLVRLTRRCVDCTESNCEHDLLSQPLYSAHSYFPSPAHALTMTSLAKRPRKQQTLKYDAVLLFWRTVTQIFFREIRPRGAFNIPREGPVIFVGAPHNNQVRHSPIARLQPYIHHFSFLIHCCCHLRCIVKRTGRSSS